MHMQVTLKGADMTDEQILTLYFERNEAAIRETEAKYGRSLRLLSRNLTGSFSDAEECVNDAFLAAWNQIPPDRPKYYYAYLAKIVRNLSVNVYVREHAKKRGADTVVFDEELAEIIPDERSAGLDDVLLGAVVREFLLKLPKEDRILFVRRHFYGDSLTHLAGLSGYTSAGLSVRLHRIRAKLKQYLREEGFTV